VKIVAEYLPPKENIVNPISFSLLIETHSDEFEVFDVQKISFLRINDGPLRAAAKWTPSGKGHHLDGTITFAQALPQGTHNLKLIIRNIDGVDERTLEWDITKKG
jgi:hypothetical protein